MKFLNQPVAGWASETKLNFAVRKCTLELAFHPAPEEILCFVKQSSR
jgi:hypothetical protein